MPRLRDARMTGDTSLGAFIFTLLCLMTVIGLVAAVNGLVNFHRAGVERLRAHQQRQETR